MPHQNAMSEVGAIRRLIRVRSICDSTVKVSLMSAVTGLGLAIVTALVGGQSNSTSGSQGTLDVLFRWCITGALGGGVALACIAILVSLGLSAMIRLKDSDGADKVVDPQPGESFGSVVCISTDDRLSAFGPSSPKLLQLGWRAGLGGLIALGIPFAFATLLRSSGWLDILKVVGLVVGMLAMIPLVLTRFTSRWDLVRRTDGPMLRLLESSLLGPSRTLEIPVVCFVAAEASQDSSDFWTVELRYRPVGRSDPTTVRLALLDATGIGKWQAQRLAAFITRWMSQVPENSPLPSPSPQ